MATTKDGHLQHISQQFNTELVQLKSDFLKMGGLVESQINQAILALETQDAELAEETRAKDKDVDQMERTIDEEANRVIVRRQPTASDLRLVMSVVKMVADLERVGDEAKKISKLVIAMASSENPARGGSNSFAEVRQIGNHVSSMLRDALDAFTRFDTELALRIMKEDKLVDEDYKAATRSLVTVMMEDPRKISFCLTILWVLRSLERVGDHACNVAEYVIYMVEGEDVRHTSIDRTERLLRP